MHHAIGAVVAALVVLVLTAMTPHPADAMCCACRSCPGMTAFCVDDLNNSVVCATLCVTSGCPSAVFDSADTCADGCNGAPVVSTATASSTPTVTPTATATATATETAALSGQILYYAGDLPVPGVNVALVAGTTQTTITDAEGNFGFASAHPGPQMLDPTKQNDFNLAVTALDGTRVLEFVAGFGNFDANQRLAADVSGDGTISALDGTRILEFAAGALLRFAVADNCMSDWAFRPMPVIIPNQTLVEPDIGPVPECTRGAIEYEGGFMPPAAQQDFTAVLFGDVTGNWMPDPPP